MARECFTSWPWYILKITQFLKIYKYRISGKRWEPAKNAPYHNHAGWYSTSNGITANVVANNLDLNFQGQTFQMAILTNGGKYKYYYCRQIGSKIFAIEWCHYERCTSWLWPTFSRLRSIWWTVRASEKCSGMTFIEVCHRMGPLWMLHSMTLTFIVKVKIFVLRIVIKKCANRGCRRHIFLDSHGPAVEWLFLVYPAHSVK